jgi:DNA mismatch repair protein MSH2
LGLAWSIAEYLATDIKCFSLFATHFHEITALSDSVKVAKNFHLAAITDNGQLTLLFQVKPGPIDKSFGIQVAEIAQLPTGVLNDAKKFLEEIEMEQKKGGERGEKEMKIGEMLEKIKSGIDFDLDMLESL